MRTIAVVLIAGTVYHLSMTVEYSDVHESGYSRTNHASVRSIVFISLVNAQGVPVGPVNFIFENNQTEWMR